jgi:hypothetical protein
LPQFKAVAFPLRCQTEITFTLFATRPSSDLGNYRRSTVVLRKSQQSLDFHRGKLCVACQLLDSGGEVTGKSQGSASFLKFPGLSPQGKGGRQTWDQSAEFF